MTTSKFFSTIIAIIILAISAGFTLAEENEALQLLCVHVGVYTEGQVLNGQGLHLGVDTSSGWVDVTAWYAVGQSYEMYDLESGNYARFEWLYSDASPFVETYGSARVDIYSGAEAEAACNGVIDTGIYDGRINSHFNHMLATVYPSASGDGFDIYSYNTETGVGELDFTVAWDQIEAAMAVAEEAHEWQLVASGVAGSFFAGSDGECFIVSPNASGEMQTFAWTCAS